MFAIVADRLGKTYPPLFGRGGHTALVDVSFALPAGERVALVGANGSGKSTLLRLLATLLRPSQGKAQILGHDLAASFRAVRRRIAHVGGDGQGLDPRLTGTENALFRAALYGIDTALARHRLDGLAGIWELGDLLSRRVRELSTGERARLALALALLSEPHVLLLDEPTRSLDPKTTEQVWRWLRPHPLTVVWASHDPQECLQVADRLLVLKGGRLMADGSPADVAPDGRQSLLGWYQ
jgi:ABC-2 type transport system ATP-binding protein